MSEFPQQRSGPPSASGPASGTGSTSGPGPGTQHVHPERLIHLQAQPRTWLGRLVAAVVGVAVLVAMFFVSLIVFAVIASVAIVGGLYMVWLVRKARRQAMANVVDVEAREPRQP